MESHKSSTLLVLSLKSLYFSSSMLSIINKLTWTKPWGPINFNCCYTTQNKSHKFVQVPLLVWQCCLGWTEIFLRIHICKVYTLSFFHWRFPHCKLHLLAKNSSRNDWTYLKMKMRRKTTVSKPEDDKNSSSEGCHALLTQPGEGNSLSMLKWLNLLDFPSASKRGIKTSKLPGCFFSIEYNIKNKIHRPRLIPTDVKREDTSIFSR